MAILEFEANELVTRNNVNSRISQANGYFPVSIANGGTGGTTESSAISSLGIDGTALYSNSSGTNGTVLLSETSANFNRMMIYFKHNDGEHGSLEINSPDGKSALLSTMKYRNDNVTYITSSKISISGTQITWTGDHGYNRLKSQPEITMNNVEYMYITKVVGYKY